jgi:hypothetical protein
VDPTVELDHQPDRPTAEVRDEGTDWELAAELQVQPPIPQDFPQGSFRGRLPFPQIPSQQIAHQPSRSIFPEHGI